MNLKINILSLSQVCTSSGAKKFLEFCLIYWVWALSSIYRSCRLYPFNLDDCPCFASRKEWLLDDCFRTPSPIWTGSWCHGRSQGGVFRNGPVVTGNRVTKSQKKKRLEWAMKKIDQGVGFSELASLVSETWGCSRRNARRVVSDAHKEWMDVAFGNDNVDQRDLLFQCIARLERTARKAEEAGNYPSARSYDRCWLQLPSRPRRTQVNASPQRE